MSGSINFASIAQYEELIFQNPDNHIARIKPKSDDFSLSILSLETLFKQTKSCLESSTIAVSFEEDLEQAIAIERIMNLKKPLIQARNKILDNPLKYLLPHYRRKLSEIDAKLDKLDLSLYQIEKKNSIEATKLDEMVLTAQAKLAKYSRYFPTESTTTIQSSFKNKFASSPEISAPEVENNEKPKSL